MDFTPVTPPRRIRKDREFTVNADTASALINAAVNGWVASDERFGSMKAAIAYGQKVRRDVSAHLDMDAANLKLRTRTWEDNDTGKFIIAFYAVPKEDGAEDGAEDDAEDAGEDAGEDDTEDATEDAGEDEAPAEVRGRRGRR